jgi:opacity protein-like surface antigen
MKRAVLGAVIAAALGSMCTAANALGPVSAEMLAPEAPVTQASAARDRRLMMMGIIQQQQMRAYRRGYRPYGYGYGQGYGAYRPYPPARYYQPRPQYYGW